MKSQSLTFFLAVAILIVVWIAAFAAKQRGRPFLEAEGGAVERWSTEKLLLASFLTLFAELAFIRWIAVEVRVFAYFKNLALLLCFVGFGLGCALAHRALRWSAGLAAFLGLVLVLRLPWRHGMFLETLSQTLGAAPDVEIWGAGNVWNWAHFLLAALLAETLFLLLVSIFVPLGQIVSRQMDSAPRPLPAYSINLIGSLAGILVFLGVSRLMLPPSIWLGSVLVGFALLQVRSSDRILLFSLLVPLFLLVHDPATPNHYSIWTPYQQIDYSRFYAANGDFVTGHVLVNHVGY